MVCQNCTLISSRTREQNWIIICHVFAYMAGGEGVGGGWGGGGVEVLKCFVRGVRIFSSHEYKVLMVSYCDQSISIVRRASCVVRRQQFVLKANSS